ncbi:S1 family peptidase [Saccharopolyspora pogona]|uniref:S1 family peptidase n=1 Tax=Saccharopolyspora pogona TaxID=333966 RepID=UPI0016872FFB|nr:serine protease [Saccharopolyspora pogona]
MPRGSLIRSILAFAATMLASLALAAPTASAVATPLIIGGTQSTQTYSFMASMQSTDGQHHCGASLVDKQWLVTAAHCVEGQQPSKVQYRIGSTDRTSGGELVKPDKFVAHPKSTQKQAGNDVATGYDIAMVHLSQPVKAQPIKISATPPQPGTAVQLLGWGQTCGMPKCGEPPVTLKELATKTIAASNCTSSQDPFDATRELCIDNQKGKVNACYGDSGGPAVVQEDDGLALVGATSRGQAENCAEKPGIYSNLVAHTDWINETINSGGSSKLPGKSPGRLPDMPTFPSVAPRNR